MITEYFSSQYPYKRFYITDDSDIPNVEECVHGSEILNTVKKELWILHQDNKWHKFGASDTINAGWENAI